MPAQFTWSLDELARRTSKVARALLLRAALDRLSTSSCDDRQGGDTSDLWFHISKVPLSLLIEHATPLLWTNLFKINWDMRGSLQPTLTAMLALHALDSFLWQIIGNGKVHVVFGAPVAIVLPQLGCAFTNNAHALQAKQLPGGGILLESDLGERISLATPVNFCVNERLISVPIRDFDWARAVLTAEHDQFDTGYCHMLLPPFMRTSDEFETTLHDALHLVKTVYPSTLESIRNDVSWMVQISSPSVSTHTSLTSRTARGAVFLSSHASAYTVAEALVHEHGHTVLNNVLDTEPIVACDMIKYSPWRTDPRPLIGLFHALFVFVRVMKFIAKVADYAVEPVQCDQLRRREILTYHRLRIGFGQVQPGELTVRGREIFASLREATAVHGTRRDLHKSACPQSVLDHAREFAGANAVYKICPTDNLA